MFYLTQTTFELPERIARLIQVTQFIGRSVTGLTNWRIPTRAALAALVGMRRAASAVRVGKARAVIEHLFI